MKNGKKICFIIPKFVTFSTGGAELQVYFLSERFLKEGWEVELVVSNLSSMDNIVKSKHYNSKIRYSQYKIFKLFRSLEFLSVFFTLLRTKSYIYYQRTDHALTGSVGLYCKLFRKKMVYALANDDELYRNKYKNEFKTYPYTNKIKKLIRRADVGILDKLVEFGKKQAHYVLAQTNFQKKVFSENFNKSPFLVRNSFQFKPNLHSKKENIILWVANFRAVKQAHMFLNLVEALKHTKWQFIMMGDVHTEGKGDENLEMISKVTSKNFSFLGHVDYKEALNWFERAKIIVNTSKHEGFSNTFIQAWIYKVFLISMNVDPDLLIADKGYGRVSGGSFNELKKVVDKILEEFDSFQDKIEEAHQFALNEFNIENNFEKILKIIE